MARILVIDDDDSLRSLLLLLLRRGGHEATEAHEGEEGLRLCATQSFDLVLCDILMPGREGLETIRDLRKDHPTTKVIAMSGGLGLTGMDPLRVAVLLGACRTIAKPFGTEQLLRTVAEALAGSPSGQRPRPGSDAVARAAR